MDLKACLCFASYLSEMEQEDGRDGKLRMQTHPLELWIRIGVESRRGCLQTPKRWPLCYSTLAADTATNKVPRYCRYPCEKGGN